LRISAIRAENSGFGTLITMVGTTTLPLFSLDLWSCTQGGTHNHQNHPNRSTGSRAGLDHDDYVVGSFGDSSVMSVVNFPNLLPFLNH
jgi:hypothetical protein